MVDAVAPYINEDYAGTYVVREWPRHNSGIIVVDMQAADGKSWAAVWHGSAHPLCAITEKDGTWTIEQSFGDRSHILVEEHNSGHVHYMTWLHEMS